MPVFNSRGINNIQNILNSESSSIPASSLKKLENKVDAFQRKSNISGKVRSSLEGEIDRYYSGSNATDKGQDVKLAMLLILMNRYIKRVPQRSLFEDIAPEPSQPIIANSGIADGARIHLLHTFKRPYYYGINALCDSSGENAEQFLHMAGKLVKASEARIITGKPPELSSSYQHKLLTEKAQEIIREWSFPKHEQVKKLCFYIGSECQARSLEANASLDGGANATGVPEEEFENLGRKYPNLAQILKFGVAYNAISIKRYHKAKNILWALIELTGPVVLYHGLTLNKGGFLERKISDLIAVLKDD